MKKEYDYLLVGAGLFNAVFAHQAKMHGKRCLVIDKRPHLGGNVYCEDIDGITVHKYGPHIFHTSNKEVWDYVNSFVPFNRFTLNTLAYYKGRIFNLPFNMNTFHQMWGVVRPEEAKAKILQQTDREKKHTVPSNLEEQAIAMVGRDIYETLIKGYTEKQWGRPCSELPAFIIKRLPIRFTYDNNYYNDSYQGIPEGGYNVLINRLLDGIECHTSCNYNDNHSSFEGIANKTICTGPIDEFFDYKLGKLEYRSLYFEHDMLLSDNYQGNAIVNYTDLDVPYTRIVEHKWFDINNSDIINAPHTVITREYPKDFSSDTEPYYPINTIRNIKIYDEYISMAKEKRPDVIFSGRLGLFKYLNMDEIIKKALDLIKHIRI